MTILKLALKNLLGAGLRTWLNVFVLSLSFVLHHLHPGPARGHEQAGRGGHGRRRGRRRPRTSTRPTTPTTR
ncbi:MAG: hypothetical protein MZU79_07255 [Anaerotruncus sp.]|nr:hypothetical protein [Anaerotruncus sp.]